MMSRFRQRDFDLLPPRPRLLAPSLRLAPELAVLAVLDDALRTALTALVAQHPALEIRRELAEPTELRRARRVARVALALRDEIDDYRDAVQDVLEIDPPPDDDIDF